jgi:hypothetical protein
VSLISPELKAKFEQRVTDEINRRSAIDPNSDRKKVVDWVIRLEKERLKTKLDKLESEESDNDNEIQELVLRAMIDELLPALERSLKNR